MEILGYVAALFVGLSLGLTGSGGSILTVPILVYLMHFDVVISTAYSLFIVGITSLIGSLKFYQKGQIDFRTAAIFGVPSLFTVFLTRSLLIPAIPEELFTLSGFTVTRDLLLLLLFALLMILASASMIRKRKFSEVAAHDINYMAVTAQGVTVGLISGLVGAGGGFLIVPALVLLVGLDMKRAVGTSLVIIAANSLIGFSGDVLRYEIDWTFLMTFSALSIAGILIGSMLSSKIDGQKMKVGFGWFVLAMGIYILIRELFLS